MIWFSRSYWYGALTGTDQFVSKAGGKDLVFSLLLVHISSFRKREGRGGGGAMSVCLLATRGTQRCDGEATNELISFSLSEIGAALRTFTPPS